MQERWEETDAEYHHIKDSASSNGLKADEPSIAHDDLEIDAAQGGQDKVSVPCPFTTGFIRTGNGRHGPMASERLLLPQVDAQGNLRLRLVPPLPHGWLHQYFVCLTLSVVVSMCSGGVQARRYNPFGGGVRNCLGQQLARMNVPTAVAMFVSNFHLKLTPEVC